MLHFVLCLVFLFHRTTAQLGYLVACLGSFVSQNVARFQAFVPNGTALFYFLFILPCGERLADADFDNARLPTLGIPTPS